jgi:hypothetical protein
MEEETVSASKPNPLEGVEERTKHWLLARSNLTEDGTLVYKKKKVVTVQEKALHVVAKQRLGLFQSNRENDQLNAALDNPEHTGCIRGIGSQMLWKHDFRKDSTRYKKRDRYKKTLEEKIEEKVNTFFENRFMAFIQNLRKEGPSPLHLLAPQATNLSSMGSTIGLVTWYPVDDITVDTPCRLHIPLGRVRNKTKDVVIGVAMPRRVFYNNPIPAEYAKVLIQEIADMGYTDYPLDHVMPEGVKELGQTINQFILWNRREIFLDGLISPQKQRIQLSQTPMSSPVDHALATPSGKQVALQLPSRHTEQEALQQPLQSLPNDNEALQQPLQSLPNDNEALQQPLMSSPTLKDKEAPQLPSPPTETEAPKDKEASHVQVMPRPHLVQPIHHRHLLMTQSMRT